MNKLPKPEELDIQRIPKNGAERFMLAAANPNEAIGGGGCLCGQSKPADQHGPFAVFHQEAMDSGYSPHVVICAPCAKAIVVQLEEGGELAELGERIDERQDLGKETDPMKTYGKTGPGDPS